MLEFIAGCPGIAHHASFDRRMLEAHGVNCTGRRVIRHPRVVAPDLPGKRLAFASEPDQGPRHLFEEGNHPADHDARLTGRAFALMMKHSSGLSEDKRDSRIRETSRRGHDAEGALLVAASGANSGQIGINKAWSTPKRQGQGVKPGTSGTSRRPIGAK